MSAMLHTSIEYFMHLPINELILYTEEVTALYGKQK